MCFSYHMINLTPCLLSSTSGNMKFRDEARKLRHEYRHRDTSRQEKFILSQVRVQLIMLMHMLYIMYKINLIFCLLPLESCRYCERVWWKISREGQRRVVAVHVGQSREEESISSSTGRKMGLSFSVFLD